MATDDEIIRKRLLIDGDGRRINGLLKSFIKWSTSTDTKDQGNEQYQKILNLLSQCEFAMAKANMIYDMNKEEMQNYEKLYKDIEQKISNAYQEINACKIELQEAKTIRRNKQEYDALARVIEQHPDRKESQTQIEDLEAKMKTLTKTKDSLESQLEMRRKQFHLLVQTIQELQLMLEDDGSESSAHTASQEAETPMET